MYAKINGNIDLPKSETKSLNSSNPLNLSKENLQTIWNNNAGTDEYPIKWTTTTYFGRSERLWPGSSGANFNINNIEQVNKQWDKQNDKNSPKWPLMGAAIPYEWVSANYGGRTNWMNAMALSHAGLLDSKAHKDSEAYKNYKNLYNAIKDNKFSSQESKKDVLDNLDKPCFLVSTDVIPDEEIFGDGKIFPKPKWDETNKDNTYQNSTWKGRKGPIAQGMNQWNRVDENWLKNNYYGNNNKWWSDLNADKYKKNKSGTVKLVTGYEMCGGGCAGAPHAPTLADCGNSCGDIQSFISGKATSTPPWQSNGADPANLQDTCPLKNLINGGVSIGYYPDGKPKQQPEITENYSPGDKISSFADIRDTTSFVPAYWNASNIGNSMFPVVNHCGASPNMNMDMMATDNKEAKCAGLENLKTYPYIRTKCNIAGNFAQPVTGDLGWSDPRASTPGYNPTKYTACSGSSDDDLKTCNPFWIQSKGSSPGGGSSDCDQMDGGWCGDQEKVEKCKKCGGTCTVGSSCVMNHK